MTDDDLDRMFAAARPALDPPAGAQERVLAGVVAAAPLPAGAGDGGGSVAPGSAPATGSLGGGSALSGAVVVKAVAVTLVVAVVVALAAGLALRSAADADTPRWSRTDSRQPRDSRGLRVAPAEPEVDVADIIDADAAAQPPGAAPAPLAKRGKAETGQPAAEDRLGEEVALLRRAQAALRGGNAGQALALLDQHQREFPRGVLAHERTVTRIQAYCRSGQLAKAQAIYRRIAGASPNSPHLASLRNSCPGLLP